MATVEMHQNWLTIYNIYYNNVDSLWYEFGWANDPTFGYRSNDCCKLGFYFVVVPQGAHLGIPLGVTITSAYLRLKPVSPSQLNTVVRCKITGTLGLIPPTIDDVPTYRTVRGTVVGGADDSYITQNQVSWDPVPPFVYGTYYNSPDISSVISEIIAQDGWDDNKSIGLFIDDHDNLSDNINYRYRKPYFLNLYLIVNYIEGTTNFITSIKHQYQRYTGLYNMEIKMGDVNADFTVPGDIRPKSSGLASSIRRKE